MSNRILAFARALCDAYPEPGHAGCVMSELGKTPCTTTNCAVLPIAIKTLAELDARFIFKKPRATDRNDGVRNG